MKSSAHPLPLATHTLPWFALLALAVGTAPFAVSPATILKPGLAIAALIVLAAETLLTRIVPALRRRTGVRVVLDILALLAFASLMTSASGALDSHLMALFLLPLTAAAIVLSRLGFVLMVVLVTFFYVLMAAITPGIELLSSAVVIRLIGDLAPKLIATGAISLLITQMHQAEQQIRDLSSRDALTGLLNLRSFEQTLDSAQQHAGRSGRGFSVAVIDIDNLAQINEAHGHDAGNQLLIAVADAVRRSIRSMDSAARLGGDEMAVLLLDSDPTAATTVAQRIRNNVYAGTVSIGNRLVRANVSIGMAHFPMDGLLPKELVAHALAALQKERSQRRPDRVMG